MPLPSRLLPTRRPHRGPAPLVLLGWALAVLATVGAKPGAAKPAAQGPGALAWPPPPEAARARFVTEYRTSRDLGRSGSFVLRAARGLAGAKPKGQVSLMRPTDVWAADSTRLFVTDASASALYLFDVAGRAVRHLGTDGPGMLAKPMGLGGDEAGRVYVADPPNRRVVVFDATGRYVRAFGGREELLNPVDVAVEPGTGRAWVVDSHLHQVVVFDSTGAVWKRLGRDDSRGGSQASEWQDPVPGHGTSGGERGAHDARENRSGADGEFHYPSSITRSPSDRFLVSDGLNGRVQSFAPDGTFLASFGRLGDTPGSLPRPKGLACDSQGNVWVVDAAFNNLQVFDEHGALLLAIGSLGREPGQFWLPMGLHIDRDDLVYVADRYNGRVQVLRFLPVSAPTGPSPGAERDSTEARSPEGGPK